LTVVGEQRARHPGLAEAVPTLENGLWKLLPDGRMELTWTIREGARWHDGAPLTAEDLLFSLQVGRDREMSAFNAQAYAAIEEVRTPDARTLTLTWREPFIEADSVLDTRSGGLLPKHLLEATYRSDKTSVLELPYWTSEFVGAGPFRLKEWTPGVGIVLDANDDYVLGRPKIDQIEVKPVPDANTLYANVLAGVLDLVPNLGSTDLALQLRSQWHTGSVFLNFGSNWVVLFPQFIDPQPPAVADFQFRRALAQAIDRQEMADTLASGLSPVPHSFLDPNQAAYHDIEATLRRYDYDPKGAAQILENLGFRKSVDGTYQESSSQPIKLEVRSTGMGQTSRAASAVADYWKRLGVDATTVVASSQQFQDPEYQATFPSFLVVTGPNDLLGLRFLHSSQTRLPSNGFRVAAAGNRSRYMNPEFDALLDKYFATVPVPERTQDLGEIIRHIADQVTLLGLFYNPIPAAASNRVINLSTTWDAFFITWNANEWDLST